MTQTKLSDEQMRWANFLSQFNFHIAYIARKNISIADALSRRPLVNANMIAHHNDLMAMIHDYSKDEILLALWLQSLMIFLMSPIL